MTEAGTTLPDGAGDANKKQAATKDQSAAGTDMQYLSGPGMQRSLNPKKDQPKTMRFLRK